MTVDKFFGEMALIVDITVWGKSGENFALAKNRQEFIIEGQFRRNTRSVDRQAPV